MHRSYIAFLPFWFYGSDIHPPESKVCVLNPSLSASPAIHSINHHSSNSNSVSLCLSFQGSLKNQIISKYDQRIKPKLPQPHISSCFLPNLSLSLPYLLSSLLFLKNFYHLSLTSQYNILFLPTMHQLSLIHISEPTRQYATSRMPSSA